MHACRVYLVTIGLVTLKIFKYKFFFAICKTSTCKFFISLKISRTSFLISNNWWARGLSSKTFLWNLRWLLYFHLEQVLILFTYIWYPSTIRNNNKVIRMQNLCEIHLIVLWYQKEFYIKLIFFIFIYLFTYFQKDPSLN